ncbi:uncharacterized protein LOC143181034 [Calliopsis andreniformis]|uniref:uncharacterized protein LOC143181034 n=1 Tax=Calliopsis andreniformis TaxID=337506 RepID=UPI003FCE58BE
MVEVQQLRDPLEGEPDCNPYPAAANPSPLIAGFASFRLSSERCRNRLNRKLKGDGSAVVLEKVSKDKVAKKTKLKAIKQRNVVPHSKGSIAGKVWETFAAVRKTREPSDIIETALIVGLDRLNVSSYCENLNDSAFYDETDSLSKFDDIRAKDIVDAEAESDTLVICFYPEPHSLPDKPPHKTGYLEKCQTSRSTLIRRAGTLNRQAKLKCSFDFPYLERHDKACIHYSWPENKTTIDSEDP